MLKKFVSIILTFIFLYNISGYYLAFNLWQTSIKYFMQCQIKEKKTKDLILFTVSRSDKNNLEWENSNEFRSGGKMYDVAFRKQEGNTIYLYCYNDSKEEDLFASLNKHIKNHIDNPTNEKDSKTVLKNPVSDFYTISEPLSISYQHQSLNVFERNIFSLENILIEFPSPPPWQV